MSRDQGFLCDFIELGPDWYRSAVTPAKVQWHLDRGWNVQRIATALGVTEQRINRVMAKKKVADAKPKPPITNETLPFGWKIVRGRIEPESVEQWVVRKITEDRQNGKKLEEIASDLTKLGIKPKGGGLWFGRRILKVIKEDEKLWVEFRGIGQIP